MLKRQVTIAFLLVSAILLSAALLFAAYRSDGDGRGPGPRGPQTSSTAPAIQEGLPVA